MSKNLNYIFIGHCLDQKNNHDKVWGIIELVPAKYSYDAGSYVIFWGRRGSKYQTKIINGNFYTIRDLVESKTEKGYKKVTKSKLDDIYPNFEKDLENAAFWAVITKSDDLGAKAFDYVKEKTDIMK